MTKSNKGRQVYYESDSNKGVRELTIEALDPMEPGETVTFDGVLDRWGEPVKLSYFRSIVSAYGKDEDKKFITRSVDSQRGFESATDVKRIK